MHHFAANPYPLHAHALPGITAMTAGAPAPPPPPGVGAGVGVGVGGGAPFPPTNAANQRICRQCGLPGRYKEGKCVEKWGPGPLGPGTVCDRCRKKMKRVERRGTLEQQMQHANANANAAASASAAPTATTTTAAASFRTPPVHRTDEVGGLMGRDCAAAPPPLLCYAMIRYDTIRTTYPVVWIPHHCSAL
ncbi:hypothetical protein B0H10DRAFT_2126183 [Mycena sp. CBHHK59/15]|nr:hypothetical protein B0H10DRAFT_2126183 [Mycena sp. CBHHK59/15]